MVKRKRVRYSFQGGRRPSLMIIKQNESKLNESKNKTGTEKGSESKLNKSKNKTRTKKENECSFIPSPLNNEFLEEIETHNNLVYKECEKLMEEKYEYAIKVNEDREQLERDVEKTVTNYTISLEEIQSDNSFIALEDQLARFQCLNEKKQNLTDFNCNLKEKNRILADKMKLKLKFQHSRQENETLLVNLDETIKSDTPKKLIRRIIAKK